MTSEAGPTGALGRRLLWSREAPVASLVAVPGTPCRCTVSRRAVERMAGTKRLGPWACLDAVDRFRPLIEAAAAAKYLREGAGPDRCIHVTSADIAAAAPPTGEADALGPPPTGIAA